MVHRFNKLNVIAGCILVFMLPLLFLFNGLVLCSSISDFVYSDAKIEFCVLLTFAFSVFIYNGIDTDNTIIGSYKPKNKWYYIVSGVALLMVVVLPYKEHTLPHFAFAGLFYLTSYANIIVFSNPEHRKIKTWAVVASIILLLGHYFGWYSLAIAEQLGLIVIGINLIFENLKITE
jgi:hypothetical protein